MTGSQSHKVTKSQGRGIPLVIALGAAMFTAGCGPEGISPDWHRVSPRIDAPEFALQQLDGDTVHLSDFRGKVVVMEFWATWCGPCRFSTPSLDAVYRKNRDRGVQMLLINQGEEPDVVRKWVERRFQAPILLDRDGQVGRLYGVRGIPKLFVIDQEGRFAFVHEGYGGGLERNLKLILDELLASAPAHG